MLLAALVLGSLCAAPPAVADVPEPLRSWVGWALQDKQEALCTFLDDPAAGTPARRCAWPSRLELSLHDRGGRFAQTFRIEAPMLVSLPGSARRWPVDVTVDGAPAAAVPTRSDGAPAVMLPRGEHAVRGAFAWDSLPESLQVPVETGLLALTLRERPVEVPVWEADGTLQLQRRPATETVTEGERLEVVVHRRVVDEVPMLLHTRIDLRVAGRSREVVLGRSLPEGFVPLSLASPLPVRLDPDGRLRAQVRPGAWVIDLSARSEGALAQVTRPAPEGTWSDDGSELWVFEARPTLREVALEGVELVDSQLTELPAEWKRFPAFYLPAGEGVRLVERRRGDSVPSPDSLNLQRELWLDLDGGGYTVRDSIRGTTRAQRLELPAPAVLGRASVNGEDLLINRLPNGHPGVELRSASVDVSADSRLPGDVLHLPVVGWAAQFQSVSAVMHLPPGFRLLHATGVDEVTPTWTNSFSLPVVLLILLVALVAWKVLGGVWGALALVALVLTITEPAAPGLAWLLVLGVEAAARVTDGRLQRFARIARSFLVLGLALSTLVFVAAQLQAGLFPAVVKNPAQSVAVGYGGVVWPLVAVGALLAGGFVLAASRGRGHVREPASLPSNFGAGMVVLALTLLAALAVITLFGQNLRALFAASANALGGQESSANVSAAGGGREGVQVRRKAIRNFGTNSGTDSVQTGPGIPSWERHNTTEHFCWKGPIPAGQHARLFLLGPRANLSLAVLRSVLVSLLLLALLRFPGRLWPARLRGAVKAVAQGLGVVLAVVALACPTAAAAQVPSPEVLEELGQRLTRLPACAPRCASNPRLLLELGPEGFVARLEVAAAAATAVPLPGAAPHVAAVEVQVDGRPAQALARDALGRLWVSLPAGVHQVVVRGRLARKDPVPLALPLAARHVEVRADGWRVDGLRDDGGADEVLLLSRISGGQAVPAGQPVPAEAMPAFLRVVRTLAFDLRWEVRTRVERVSPRGTPVVAEVALLEGESVTTGGIRVQGGKVQVGLGPDETEMAWDSVLEERPAVRLVAPRATTHVEVWQVVAGPVWHLTLAGIPPARHFADDGTRRAEWSPWPGEEVTLKVARPPAVPGQVLTLDSSSLELRPGPRTLQGSLELTLRSSRSGSHALEVPEGAVVESLAVDGRSLAARQEGRTVVVPVGRGAQQVKIGFRQDQTPAALYRVPAVGLGTEGVNAQTVLMVPEDRFVLAVGSAPLAPSVQGWAALVALALLAVGMGRLGGPLRVGHWALLLCGAPLHSWSAAMLVVAAGVLLAWRGLRPELPAGLHNLRQVALATVAVLGVLILGGAVASGFQGRPDLLVAGNASTAEVLRWTFDRTSGAMPTPWVLTAPLWAYRLAMGAWVGAVALLALRFGPQAYRAFREGGVWRREPKAETAQNSGE